MMLANLSSAIQVASGGDIGDKNIEAPELRALLENFVSSSDEIAYATLLNADAKGISAGRISPTLFCSANSNAPTPLPSMDAPITDKLWSSVKANPRTRFFWSASR